MVAQPSPDSLDSSDVRWVVTDKGRAALRRYLVRDLLRNTAPHELTAGVMVPGRERPLTRAKIAEALRFMRPRVRRAVALCVEGRYSKEAAAREMHCSPATIARDLREFYAIVVDL